MKSSQIGGSSAGICILLAVPQLLQVEHCANNFVTKILAFCKRKRGHVQEHGQG